MTHSMVLLHRASEMAIATAYFFAPMAIALLERKRRTCFKVTAILNLIAGYCTLCAIAHVANCIIIDMPIGLEYRHLMSGFLMVLSIGSAMGFVVSLPMVPRAVAYFSKIGRQGMISAEQAIIRQNLVRLEELSRSLRLAA
jgi:hypothetical protein